LAEPSLIPNPAADLPLLDFCAFKPLCPSGRVEILRYGHLIYWNEGEDSHWRLAGGIKKHYL